MITPIPVDPNVLAGYPAAVRAREERHDIGYVDRLSEATQRI